MYKTYLVQGSTKWQHLSPEQQENPNIQKSIKKIFKKKKKFLPSFPTFSEQPNRGKIIIKKNIFFYFLFGGIYENR